jgi:hypothetical protein
MKTHRNELRVAVLIGTLAFLVMSFGSPVNADLVPFRDPSLAAKGSADYDESNDSSLVPKGRRGGGAPRMSAPPRMAPPRVAPPRMVAPSPSTPRMAPPRSTPPRPSVARPAPPKPTIARPPQPSVSPSKPTAQRPPRSTPSTPSLTAQNPPSTAISRQGLSTAAVSAASGQKPTGVTGQIPTGFSRTGTAPTGPGTTQVAGTAPPRLAVQTPGPPVRGVVAGTTASQHTGTGRPVITAQTARPTRIASSTVARPTGQATAAPGRGNLTGTTTGKPTTTGQPVAGTKTQGQTQVASASPGASKPDKPITGNIAATSTKKPASPGTVPTTGRSSVPSFVNPTPSEDRVTRYPDGTAIRNYRDGRPTVVTTESGTRTEYGNLSNPNVARVTRLPDGTSITTYRDGTPPAISGWGPRPPGATEGNTAYDRRNNTSTHSWGDGTSISYGGKDPMVDRVIKLPDGTRVVQYRDGRPPVSVGPGQTLPGTTTVGTGTTLGTTTGALTGQPPGTMTGSTTSGELPWIFDDHRREWVLAPGGPAPVGTSVKKPPGSPPPTKPVTPPGTSAIGQPGNPPRLRDNLPSSISEIRSHYGAEAVDAVKNALRHARHDGIPLTPENERLIAGLVLKAHERHPGESWKEAELRADKWVDKHRDRFSGNQQSQPTSAGPGPSSTGAPQPGGPVQRTSEPPSPSTTGETGPQVASVSPVTTESAVPEGGTTGTGGSGNGLDPGLDDQVRKMNAQLPDFPDPTPLLQGLSPGDQKNLSGFLKGNRDTIVDNMKEMDPSERQLATQVFQNLVKDPQKLREAMKTLGGADLAKKAEWAKANLPPGLNKFVANQLVKATVNWFNEK